MRMRKTALGLTSLCLLTISACSTTKVRTETVYVPKLVQLPAELTAPVTVPKAEVKTNADLAEYALKLKRALEQANRQLEAIREVQPR